MGLFLLSVLCLVVLVESKVVPHAAKPQLLKKKKHVIKPLYKHHQFHPKMHHRRWLKRSDERRKKLGLPKWNPKKVSLAAFFFFV